MLSRFGVGQEPAVTSVEEKPAVEVASSEASNAGAPDVEFRERAEAWRAENRDALDSSNAYVDMYGLPLAKHQKF
jgi:antitoxin CcdA